MLTKETIQRNENGNKATVFFSEEGRKEYAAAVLKIMLSLGYKIAKDGISYGKNTEWQNSTCQANLVSIQLTKRPLKESDLVGNEEIAMLTNKVLSIKSEKVYSFDLFAKMPMEMKMALQAVLLKAINERSKDTAVPTEERKVISALYNEVSNDLATTEGRGLESIASSFLGNCIKNSYAFHVEYFSNLKGLQREERNAIFRCKNSGNPTLTSLGIMDELTSLKEFKALEGDKVVVAEMNQATGAALGAALEKGKGK